jgi:hypothetical protein
VAKALPTLTTVTLTSGRTLYRVYDGTYGYDQHNPGFGDTRFAPIDDPTTGKRLPNMYLGESPATVLLESIFHDVHDAGSKVIYGHQLVGKLLAHMVVPEDAVLGDLRDPALGKLSLTRGEVVTSPAEHYPCTRKLAIAATARPDLAFPASRAREGTATGSHRAVRRTIQIQAGQLEASGAWFTESLRGTRPRAGGRDC